MIFNGIKRRWMRKELRNNPLGQMSNLPFPRSLLVISIEPDEKEVAKYYKWASRLGIAEQQVTIIGKVKDAKKQSINDVITVDEKLIGWNGGYREKEVVKALNASNDLLITTYQDYDELMHFLGQRSQAKLKVGLGKNVMNYNNLTIQFENLSDDNTIKELKNYLSILCKN